MLRTTLAVACASLVLAGACGGDGKSDDAADDARALRVTVREEGGPVASSDNTCRYEGARKFVASGVAHNGGEEVHHVTVSVRFEDAKGVRIELGSDSVSSLEPNESARWDVSTYVDDHASVVACDIALQSG